MPAKKLDLVDRRQKMSFERNLDRAESFLDALVHQADDTVPAGDELGHQNGDHGNQHQPADGNAKGQGDGEMREL
jgi:hypothetical protein